MFILPLCYSVVMEGGPPLSFLLLLLVHLSTQILETSLRKKKKTSLAEQHLTSEIKDILRQVNLLNTPSTFAKAAKLKRIANAKEKELIQLRQHLQKGKQWLFSWQSLVPKGLKAFTYLVLVYWFWGYPVSVIPSHFIYPFDKALTWRNYSPQNRENIKIGILPWLVVCTKVCIFLTKKVNSMTFSH